MTSLCRIFANNVPMTKNVFSLLKPLSRFDLAAHVTNQCPRRPVACKYCFSPIAFVDMEKHIHACHTNNKSNVNHINDDDEDIAGTSDPASWKSGRKCPFGCQGRWHNPESLDSHKRDSSHQHLERLNKRVVRLEKSNESILNKENEENDMNVPMVGSQQQPSSPPLENDSEMEDMDETGPGMSQQAEFLQRAAVGAAAAASSSSAGSSGSNNNNSAKLESEVQRLSERLRTLESQQRLVVRADSAPSSNATTNSLPMPSSSTGFSFNNGGSASSTSSSPSRPAAAAAPREDVSGMAMRKLELCFRKAEMYEGMAMVLNVSLDRLLTQVTEIDNQRRRESESREAQERKIQVGVSIEVSSGARVDLSREV